MEIVKINELKSISGLSKSDIECLALDLKSDLNPSTEYLSLYKFKYLIEQRMNFIKGKAIEDFGNVIDDYSKIELRNLKEYTFSPEVDKLENEKKRLSRELTALKNLEKANGTAQLKSESTTIAITIL